jgi:class 3 adenylate cyclase/tetratricopeptide (TPR) repeat protein
MKCPACHFDNPSGMKFCGQCGTKLAPVCPVCGMENPPGFKFCGECGSSLTAAPSTPAPPKPAPEEPPVESQRPALQSYTPSHLAGEILQSKAALEGERKQVTVLFCDLVGSTALADRLGPETMHLLLNRFFELALGEVHRYEGTINQFLGDGFMALFGAPISHEDHARRAVLAALGLVKRLDEHRAEMTRNRVDVKVRMGVNTGWVVVGGIGDQLRKDYSAIGDTTNLAARLQQAAEPGAILVSDSTMRFLHGSIQAQPIGPLHLKGKEGLIPAFLISGGGALPSEQAVMSGTALSGFVGRKREMLILDDLRERAAAGEGQILGIAADAGAGKSRLLFEFRRRLWDQPVLYLTGRCLSYGSGVPYLPLLDMLRNEWGIEDADAPAAVADKMRASLERAGMEAGESLPYLLHLLGIREGTESLAALSPQALQSRTFALLRQFILSSGQGRLVVLQIEDLHWIDHSSEELLGYLAEGLASARMLLLVTYRSGYRPRWIEKSYSTQISLPRLTEQESRQVVESVLRESKLPEGLVETALSRAEGNPFFLEELTRSFLERPDVSVPETVQGVLLARIDRLPEEHKRLLQAASVLGREFPLVVLIAVWQGEPGAGALLADLKRWEFLYEEIASSEPRCFFKHALTQEAIYQTLLQSRRQALHAAAGQAFERLHADRLEDVYDRLAYHYSEAGKPKKAVFYLVRFADRAAASYAHAEAARALREALGHAARLPNGDRDRQTVELVLRLAESLLPLAQLPETLDLLEGHRDVVERLGDPALSGRFHFWLAHTHSYLGNQAEASSHALQAIEEAQASGDDGTEGRACYVLSRDAFWAGEFSEGIRYGLKAVALLERTEDRWWQGQAYWVVGFHHYVLGRFEWGLEAMARAYSIYETLKDPRLDPSWSTGYFHASLGDGDAGIRFCQAGLGRAQDPLNTAAALGFLGYAWLQKGDLAKAIETLEDSIRRIELTGMRQLQGWFSAFLAEAYLRDGRPGEALPIAEQAVAVTLETRFWYGVGLARRSLGMICRVQERRDEAQAHLHDAVEGFRSHRVPFEVARTRLELALLAHDGGDASEAAAQLRQAHRAFQELGAQRYVERAEQVARELSVSLALAS